jgi:hypothetical protein
MRELHITLWRHEQERDWSIEIDGHFHSHVSIKTVDELAEYALIKTQEFLMNPEALTDNGAAWYNFRDCIRVGC